MPCKHGQAILLVGLLFKNDFYNASSWKDFNNSKSILEGPRSGGVEAFITLNDDPILTTEPIALRVFRSTTRGSYNEVGKSESVASTTLVAF
jgi:hypothetical protein